MAGGGSPAIRGCNFHPICNDVLAIKVGPKGPKCWAQASAGDYKGAQPPYLADKCPEGTLSASHPQKDMHALLSVEEEVLAERASLSSLPKIYSMVVFTSHYFVVVSF